MLRARRENYKVKKVTDSNPVSLEKVIEKGNIFQLLLVQKKVNQIKRGKALESSYHDILERVKIRKTLKRFLIKQQHFVRTTGKPSLKN